MNTFDQIMIIDDNFATNNFHRRLIEKSGIAREVILLKNGKEGIDFFIKAPTKPALVLLDLNMPIMNGFEFLGVLNTLLSPEEKQHTHVVILSSSDETRDEERCKELYANLSYAEKPLTQTIIEKIASRS